MQLSQLSEGILNEAGLNRILGHSVDTSTSERHKKSSKPFTIVTAFRGDKSLAQNRKRNRELEGQFRTIGAGGIKLIGHWLEAPEGTWFGKSYEEVDPEQCTDVVEESYFVPIPAGVSEGEFKQWVLGIVNQFNQDAAVYSDGASVFLMDKLGDLVKIGDGITINKINQAYSSIRKSLMPPGKTRKQGYNPVPRHFVFEGTMSPSSWAHKLLLRTRSVGWV